MELDTGKLSQTLKQLLDKCILAADESESTANKRLAQIGLAPTPENRWLYRLPPFMAPAMQDYISGVILFEGTFNQQMPNGALAPAFLQELGVAPIIKIDRGMEKVGNGEVIRVLDGLSERLGVFARGNAAATKFRWAFGPRVDDFHVELNALLMASAALCCLQAGMVPMIEPELDRAKDGGRHTIRETEEATRKVLGALRKALVAVDAPIELCIIKTNMIEPGANCPEQAEVNEVADRTLRVVEDVAGAAGGVVFLSGGMTTRQAMMRLNRIAQLASPERRQKVGSSYSRALLGPALEAWAGDMSRWALSQQVFLMTARANLAARRGELDPAMLQELEAAVHQR